MKTISEYMKEYYIKNYEKVKQRVNRYRLNNPNKIKEQRLNWRINNKEHLSIYNKSYRELHRDKILDYLRKYYEENKEQHQKTQRVWNHNNRIKIRSMSQNRKLRLKLAGILTIKVVQRVYENNIKKYGTLTCYLCGLPTPFGKDALEHKIPISRNGTNEYENLAIACKSCNSKKGIKTYEEYKNR